MTLQPLFNRLLVKRTETQEITAGGIVIPDNAREKPQEGVVVAAGPGRMLESGVTVPMSVSVGAKIMFSKYVGTDVETPEGTLLVLFEEDVLAIVKEDLNGI